MLEFVCEARSLCTEGRITFPRAVQVNLQQQILHTLFNIDTVFTKSYIISNLYTFIN